MEPASITNEEFPLQLTVLVPVYNEKNTILAVLEKLNQLKITKEVIVIDNCSTDGTRELLQKSSGIDRLILQEQNLGKGNSIRKALPYARGKFTVIQDGDLEYNPDSFYEMLEVAEKNRADAVYGSRVREGIIRTRYLSYYEGVRFLTFTINLLYGGQLTDAATTYKMVRTSVFQKLNLKCNGFDLDFELTNQLLKNKICIFEIPIPYTPRSFKEGKKIRAIDGLKALWVILKNRVE